MPVTPIELFEHTGLRPAGVTAWGRRPSSAVPGVYVVAQRRPCAAAPIDPDHVAGWLARVGTFALDGEVAPATAAVVARLSQWWLPEELILYIGKATSVSNRVGQYYRTPLGDRGPHAGGHWIKTLSILDDLEVYWAAPLDGKDPGTAEARLMEVFARLAAVPAAYPGGSPLPFANLEGPGGRRPHGLTGTKLGRSAATAARPAPPVGSAGSGRGADGWYTLERAVPAAAGEPPLPAQPAEPTPTFEGRTSMQGKTTFTAAEAETIRQLLQEKERADSSRQKSLRGRIRALRFYITDFAHDQKGFTSRDFDALVQRGAIQVSG